MSKQVQQIRFYKNGDSKNQPINGVTANSLISGSVFKSYVPIVQLGIQSLPGTKFYLNDSTEPIIIGYTGIYELNVENITEINTLKFDYKSLTAISKSENASLIVDIIYEKGD